LTVLTFKLRQYDNLLVKGFTYVERCLFHGICSVYLFNCIVLYRFVMYFILCL